MNWKVKNNVNCKICDEEITKPKFRTFCSKKCRIRSYTIKYLHSRNEWQRKQRGHYSPNKLKCGLCGSWYIQVGSHIVQRHGITAREYREEMNLPVSRGIVLPSYRKFKGEIALKNGTYKNLISGKPHRFKKGDKRTTHSTFWKSRRREPDELYV